MASKKTKTKKRGWKKKESPLKIIRETPGIGWIRPIAKLPKAQRIAALQPILERTTDRQTKRAIRVFIRHGQAELEKMARSEANFRRLFIWDWFCNYMEKNGYNDHSKPSRSLKRHTDACFA